MTFAAQPQGQGVGRLEAGLHRGRREGRPTCAGLGQVEVGDRLTGRVALQAGALLDLQLEQLERAGLLSRVAPSSRRPPRWSVSISPAASTSSSSTQRSVSVWRKSTTSKSSIKVSASSTNTCASRCASVILLPVPARLCRAARMLSTDTSAPAVFGSFASKVTTRAITSRARSRTGRSSANARARSSTRASARPTPAWTETMPAAWCTSARSSMTGMDASCAPPTAPRACRLNSTEVAASAKDRASLR